MSYRVVITDKAKKRISEIFDYFVYELYSPIGAKRQVDRILDAAESLDTFPNRFAVLLIDNEHLRGIRRMLVGPYSVFYRVQEDEKLVLVLSVLSSASNFKTKLVEDVGRE